MSHAFSNGRPYWSRRTRINSATAKAGVRVVHLDGSLGGQQLDIVVLLAEAAHDVADGAGDQEVLLHQAKFLAGHGRVGGIQHARDVLAGDFLLDGVDVVAAVEDLDVEVFGSARREQTQAS